MPRSVVDVRWPFGSWCVHVASACCTRSPVDALMLYVSRRPFSASPHSGFVPHAQASAPPRICGQQLELTEGISPRELSCNCPVEASKPFKTGTPRFFAFCISATALHLPLFRLTSLRACAGAAPLLYVVEECLCSFGRPSSSFFCQQRDFAAGVSAPMFFGMGSWPSPPSLPLSPFLKFLVLEDTP